MTKLRHIVIGTPIKEQPLDVYREAVEAFAASCDPEKVKLTMLGYKSGLVKARDTICAFALHERADDVLMWDSDNTAKPEQVHRLLAHDVDIVGAAYTTKAAPVRWVYTPMEGVNVREDGLLRVIECGTGLKRYRVSALRTMCEAHPYQEYDAAERNLPPGAKRFNLHFCGVVNRRWISEDFGFDYLAREAGLRIYVDTQVISPHWGLAPYPREAPPMPGVVAAA